MITGDLIRCNDTGSIGVITSIKPVTNSYKSANEYYNILFQDGTQQKLIAYDFKPLEDSYYESK